MAARLPASATVRPAFKVRDLIAMEGPGVNEKSISFIVLGNPEVQQRSKIVWKGLVNGAWPNRNTPIIHDPSSALKKAHAQKVRAAMVEMGLTFPFFPIAGSGADDPGLVMEAAFYMERPPSHYNGDGLRRDAPQYPKKKDVDNLEKFVLDALHYVVYNNDNCIRQTKTEKRYSSSGAFTKLTFCTFRT
jgi:hypothetical protein